MSAIRKSEFAKLCNVSAPCVSQWISGGKIDGKAIVGEGRGALIDVDIGRAQLKERLSTNERCSLNGLNTKLDGGQMLHAAAAMVVQGGSPAASGDPPPVPAHARHPPAIPNVGGGGAVEDPDTVEARIKAEKLKQAQFLTSSA